MPPCLDRYVGANGVTMDMSLDISIIITAHSSCTVVDTYILHTCIPHLGGGYRVRSAQGVLQGEEGPLHIVHMGHM